MKKVTNKEIVEMVTKINQENVPNIEKYIDDFFSEYIDISFFDELTFTGEEQKKVETAITHLIQVTTLVSVTTTLEVLEKMGTIGSDNHES